MQTALRLTARVQSGHRLEIIAPELIEGEEVTITVTSPGVFAPSTAEARQALTDRLLAEGAIPFVPSGRSTPPPRLIAVRGQPVSQTIIEERG
jgi:hypothetical protein